MDSGERSRRLRTAARQGFVGVVVGAVLAVGLPGVAAAQGPPAPPGGAVAAPSADVVPKAGDGEQLWASDSCHYFQQSGQWRSDVCLLSISVDGQAVPKLYGLFQNVGNGEFGKELVRLDASEPEYLALRSQAGTAGSDPRRRVMFADASVVEQ